MQVGIILVLVLGVIVVGGYLIFTGSLEKFGVEKLDLAIPSPQDRGSDNGGGASRGGSLLPPKGQTTGSKIESKSTSTINPKDIPEGFTIEQLSPYFKRIRLSGVSAGSERSLGRVSLTTSRLETEEAVNVTGWQIKGNHGGQHIPKAAEVYDPSGLTVETDIVLKKGQTLNIYTSASAIGRNLRLNKCIGYLQNTSKFTPALPRNCPRANRAEIRNFSSECYDYVLSIGTCALPKPNVLLPFDDYACRAYLNTINYKGCFDRYRGDADFLSREWRVWTGSRFLDEGHDRVLLLDKQGLLVDIREY